MAMTPLGGFEVNVWLRTKASGTIAIGTIGTSITPEITAMVAVTPPGRLDVTMRLKSNACQDRDQRGSRGDGVSAGKDDDLRNA